MLVHEHGFVTISHSLLLLCNNISSIPLHGYAIIYACGWAFRLCPAWPVIQNIALHSHIQALISPGLIPRSGTAVPQVYTPTYAHSLFLSSSLLFLFFPLYLFVKRLLHQCYELQVFSPVWFLVFGLCMQCFLQKTIPFLRSEFIRVVLPSEKSFLTLRFKTNHKKHSSWFLL